MFKRIKRAFNTDHPSSGMADLAKSAPVVSNSPPSSACGQLNQLTDALPTSPPPPTTNGDSFADMGCFSDDGTSLQDLIDSELALRISADVPDVDDDTEASDGPIPFSGRSQEVKYDNYVVAEGDPVVVNGNGEFPEDAAMVLTNGDVAKHSVKVAADDVNTRFIMNERGHGAGADTDDDLTEADILFFNTFNQVQSNGDDGFLSSPEVENPPPALPGPIPTGFDPFATIPGHDLESPVFEAAKAFPPSSPDDVSPPSCDVDDVLVVEPVDVSDNSVVLVDNLSPTNSNIIDSPVDVNGSMDADNVDDELICVEGPTEVCSESGEMLTTEGEVTEVAQEALTVDADDAGRLLTPEIPMIGVTPPEEGTEYDEDAYYEQLERDRRTPVQAVDEEEQLEDVSPPPFLADDVSPPSFVDQPEPREDLDSWVKVDDVDFDRSDETEIEVVVPDRSLDTADQSQGSDDAIEHVVCADQPAVCINKPDSDSESSEAVTSSSSAEKKSKKKKSVDGGDTKTKRNKKNKEGKENISVSVVNAVSPTNLAASPATPNEILLEDARDLSNVSVKELRRSFGDLTNLVDKDELQSATDMSGGGQSSRPESPPVFSPVAVSPPVAASPPWSTSEQKSSFSKFDALQKKTVLHVRSVDASKVQKQFNQANLPLYALLDQHETSPSAPTEVSSNCKVCGKQVFQMEQVKAERSVYHKNCFRCLQCSKQLTVDTYSSHEGQVYCKPHFKELFQPKVVIEDDSEPASDKPDLGLEELGSLNVKSRFQVFEKADDAENPIDKSPSAVNVKRSPSILSKLARFQAKGMDVGVTDDSLNGIPLEESSSSEEEEEEEGDEDKEVVRANRKQRERPVSFGKMEDIKGRWETGTAVSKEERRQERKQEIQSIRSRLFMGHQGKMKEMYQQAVSESTNSTAAKKEDVDVCSERAKSIKERFERGEPLNADDDDEEGGRGKKPLDEDLVDAGYSKKSRTLFLELDATAAKQAPISPAKSTTVSRNESFKKPPHDIIFNRTPSQDVVRASDQVEDVVVETADIGNKFKFFETYKPTEKEKKKFRITPPRDGAVKEKTPEREIYRDPTIVRSDERPEEGEIIRSQTASKMLSFFKHMEQSANKEELPQGPKPLKRFTPPPDSELNREDESSDDDESSEEEEEEEEDEHDPNIIRSSDKQEDEFLKQAATAARAKALRAKFERWEEKEIEREREAAAVNGSATEQGDAADQTSIDSTRSIRARFESMNSEQSPVKDKQARPKVNRFV